MTEDRRICFARSPALGTILLDDGLSEFDAPAAGPEGGEIEAVIAQVADFLAPDGARVQVPIRVDETGRRKSGARQGRPAGFIVLADERLIAVLEKLHRMKGRSVPDPMILDGPQNFGMVLTDRVAFVAEVMSGFVTDIE